ncbi:MAG: sigma 54-interacting transcriptional regulator [Planctomycetes bacterium]|nr:sigma 54-interacting transcriptional regulator [Planctomycetota bacterium]
MNDAHFQLLVRSGDSTTTHTFRQDVVRIGRGKDSDLLLEDRLVSRRHCRLERHDQSFLLVDEGAANLARVRGTPVERARIQPGETFQVAGYEIQLVLPDQGEPPPEETRHGEGHRSVRDLATFIRVARALNEEQDLARLLTLIVDSAIQLAGAERGFLILGRGQETTVEVARNFAQEEVLSPEFKISRTIAHRVRDSGVTELTTNAQEDDRFRELRSVAEMRLRSVLCLPIRIQAAVEGVLYVDNRLQQQVFGEREKELLLALADHAGVAIHNARSVEQLRSKQGELQNALDRVAQLNAALKGQLAAQKEELTEIRAELAANSRTSRFRYDYGRIVGESRRMQELFRLLDKYIDADDPVLVLGESGTGKELVARVIHEQSRRSKGQFVSENCAALPEALLESELFGHVRGAVTGASANKRGLLEAASGGVLFLDEVGEMPLELQSKLLRVLQEGEVRPLGSDKVVKVDVRLIAATNRNLEEMVREGAFREDLYYRLNVLPVRVPPLRERREDIPHLAGRLLATLARETGGARIRVSPDAMDTLLRYRWPGNVRELQNELRRAAILSDGVILESHLSEAVRSGTGPFHGDGNEAVPSELGTTLPDMVEAIEVREIHKALARAQGNKSRAAELLGLSRFALQRKLEKYGLEPQRSDDGGEAGQGSGP